MVYKVISVIAATVGVFALVAMVIGFQGGNKQFSLAIIEGVIILVSLPTAYITNRMGKRTR